MVLLLFFNPFDFLPPQCSGRLVAAMLLGGNVLLIYFRSVVFCAEGELRSCCECSSCFYTHLNQATKKHFFIWKSKCTMLKNINSSAFVLSVPCVQICRVAGARCVEWGRVLLPRFSNTHCIAVQKSPFGASKGAVLHGESGCLAKWLLFKADHLPNNQGILCRLRRTVEAEFSFYFFIFFFLIHK